MLSESAPSAPFWSALDEDVLERRDRLVVDRQRDRARHHGSLQVEPARLHVVREEIHAEQVRRAEVHEEHLDQHGGTPEEPDVDAADQAKRPASA